MLMRTSVEWQMVREKIYVPQHRRYFHEKIRFRRRCLFSKVVDDRNALLSCSASTSFSCFIVSNSICRFFLLIQRKEISFFSNSTYQQIIVNPHVDIVLEVFRLNQLIHYHFLVHKKEFHTIEKQ
jgi:hypothetical protein